MEGPVLSGVTVAVLIPETVFSIATRAPPAVAVRILILVTFVLMMRDVIGTVHA